MSTYGVYLGFFPNISKNIQHKLPILWIRESENMGVARGRGLKNEKYMIFYDFQRSLSSFMDVFQNICHVTIDYHKMYFRYPYFEIFQKWAWPNIDASIMLKYEKCHFSISHKARLPSFYTKNQYKRYREYCIDVGIWIKRAVSPTHS